MLKLINLQSKNTLNLSDKELEIILGSVLFIGSGASDQNLNEFLLKNRVENQAIFEHLIQNKFKYSVTLSAEQLKLIMKSISKIIELGELGAVTSSNLGYSSNEDGLNLIKKLDLVTS